MMKSEKKKLDFQQKIITRQSKQIELLKLQIEYLKQKCQEKDDVINSVQSIREELVENAKEHRRLKNEYKELVDELKQMKKIIDVNVYKGRWKIVKFLIK